MSLSPGGALATFPRKATAKLSMVMLLGWFSLGPASSPALADPPPARSESTDAPDALTTALIEAHNRERAMEKKPPLTYNARLQAAARVQARDMAEHQKMSHEGSDGSTPAQRIERQGYFGRRIGENVAEGETSVAEVMRLWMNSPHHRENILGDYSEMGAARALDKDGTPYWCVDFGLGWPKLDPDRAAAEAVEALNQARRKADRPPFTVNETLQAAAKDQAKALADREGQEVKKDDQPNPLQKIVDSGARFDRLSELAASGQATPEAVVRSWLGSADQSKTVLSEDYSAIGVGYATARKGTPYWVVILGRPVK
jgi:uncharacterized protein YkwD